jgi:hypothetical protein
MDMNWGAVIAATVAMFAVGAFWYMVPFGKIWGKIHGFDKLSKEKQKEMQTKMGPWYGAQLVFTLVSSAVLTSMLIQMPTVSPYKIVFMTWLGFALPTTAGNMIFGGSPEGYVWHKIAISGGEILARLLLAAWVITAIIR